MHVRVSDYILRTLLNQLNSTAFFFKHSGHKLVMVPSLF